jgi:hypothetical protein
MLWADGETPINGYPVYATNQARSNLTKGTSVGVCSALFFGNWNDLVYGYWGTLDVLIDPYSLSLSGGVRVISIVDADVVTRRAQSFAAMLDALTV